MEDYIQNLQAYVREHKITFGQDSPQPCLDVLWWHYAEYHKMESETIGESFRSIWNYMETLPIQDSDNLFAEVCCLCAEYERIAFINGLRLGAQLMLEIQDA